jgi:nucleoside-diphosphate-sugar epimerase
MNILIFGASGSIGNHLYNKFKAGYNVYGSSSADNSVYPIKCKIANGQFLLVYNTGISGQSIKVDLGFTAIKKY